MDLGRDAFTVTYDVERVDVEAIMRRIRGLGFRPERTTEPSDQAQARAYDLAELPAPIADALSRARASNRLTLVDFYADWCGPCKVLETTVLGDPRVEEALAKYELIKVDTDKQVEPADYFNVVGLPTLVVLDATGVELYRVEGMIEAEELAQRLSELTAPESSVRGTVRRCSLGGRPPSDHVEERRIGHRTGNDPAR